MMPIIVVTRLRLRDSTQLDEFFTAAVAVLEQAKTSPGNLGADVLADANNAWWTLTAWQERDSMRAFISAEPHLSTMARLDDWCNEATFTDWEQATEDLPDWQTSYRHLVADGQPATLTRPSDAHQARAFPPPVEEEARS
jgi:heme-degrading monooxygenase HmoA